MLPEEEIGPALTYSDYKPSLCASDCKGYAKAIARGLISQIRYNNKSKNNGGVVRNGKFTTA